MYKRQIAIAISVTVIMVGCVNRQPEAAKGTTVELVFPKGEMINSNNFTGVVWLQMLVNNDSTYNTSIGNVTFEPNARTNWHKHAGGQILLITGGRGYYQEEGKSAVALSKGDVVNIPPDAVHWHGASAGYSLTHIAISPNTDKGSVVWLKPVSDAEYNNITLEQSKKYN